MVVPISQPVVKPAVPEKAFGIKWFYNVVIHCPNPNGEGTLRAEWYPMSEDRELLTSALTTHVVEDLWACAAAKPKVAAAIQALMEADSEIEEWLTEKEAARLAALEAERNPPVEDNPPAEE